MTEYVWEEYEVEAPAGGQLADVVDADNAAARAPKQAPRPEAAAKPKDAAPAAQGKKPSAAKPPAAKAPKAAAKGQKSLMSFFGKK